MRQMNVASGTAAAYHRSLSSNFRRRAAGVTMNIRSFVRSIFRAAAFSAVALIIAASAGRAQDCPSPRNHGQGQVRALLGDARMEVGLRANGMAGAIRSPVRPLAGHADAPLCRRLAAVIQPDTARPHVASFFEAGGYYFAVVEYAQAQPAAVRHPDGRVTLHNEENWDQIWILSPDFRLMSVQLW
jgi:hypothetical protein